MGCLDIEPFPALPDISPFTLEPPALPSLDLSVDFCCRFDLIEFHPVIPLGAVTLAVPGSVAIIAAINAAMVAIQAYIDALPLTCPRQ